MAENPEPLVAVNRDDLKQLVVDAVTEALEQQQVATTDDLEELRSELTADLVTGIGFGPLDEDPEPFLDPATTGEVADRKPVLEERPHQAPAPVSLDPDLLHVEIDPDRPETWGPNRTTPTQLVVAGRAFDHPTEDRDPWTSNDGSLSFTEGTSGLPEITEWPLDDGNPLRYGKVRHNGRSYLQFSSQFKPDDYAHRGKRVRKTGVGHSDPLYNDTTRAQITLARPYRVGPEASTVLWAASFVVQHWMAGAAHTGGPVGLHAPFRAAQGEAWASSIRHNHIEFWSHSSGPNSDPSPLAFPGREPSTKDIKPLHRVPLPEVGSELTLVGQFRCDPSGEGESYSVVYSLDHASGALTEVGLFEGEFGYYYADADQSGRFLLQWTGFNNRHNPWPPKNHPDTPWGWDRRTRDGDVRTALFGYLAAADGEQVTPNELAGRIVAVRGVGL